MKTLNMYTFSKLVILFEEIYPKKEIQEISKINGQVHINDTDTAEKLSYVCSIIQINHTVSLYKLGHLVAPETECVCQHQQSQRTEWQQLVKHQTQRMWLCTHGQTSENSRNVGPK